MIPTPKNSTSHSSVNLIIMIAFLLMFAGCKSKTPAPQLSPAVQQKKQALRTSPKLTAKRKAPPKVYPRDCREKTWDYRNGVRIESSLQIYPKLAQKILKQLKKTPSTLIPPVKKVVIETKTTKNSSYSITTLIDFRSLAGGAKLKVKVYGDTRPRIIHKGRHLFFLDEDIKIIREWYVPCRYINIIKSGRFVIIGGFESPTHPFTHLIPSSEKREPSPLGKIYDTEIINSKGGRIHKMKKAKNSQGGIGGDYVFAIHNYNLFLSISSFRNILSIEIHNENEEKIAYRQADSASLCKDKKNIFYSHRNGYSGDLDSFYNKKGIFSIKPKRFIVRAKTSNLHTIWKKRLRGTLYSIAAGNKLSAYLYTPKGSKEIRIVVVDQEGRTKWQKTFKLRSLKTYDLQFWPNESRLVVDDELYDAATGKLIGKIFGQLYAPPPSGKFGFAGADWVIFPDGTSKRLFLARNCSNDHPCYEKINGKMTMYVGTDGGFGDHVWISGCSIITDYSQSGTRIARFTSPELRRFLKCSEDKK